MKSLLFAGLLLGASACSTPLIKLDIQYDLGEQASPGPEVAARTALALEALLKSCTVDASGGPDYTSRWAAAIQGPHITVRYEEPVQTVVRGKPVVIEQILLPVPSDHLPNYVWLRANGKLRSYTKYAPSKLADVVCDPDLDVIDVPLYAEYCTRFAPPEPIDD